MNSMKKIYHREMLPRGIAPHKYVYDTPVASEQSEGDQREGDWTLVENMHRSKKSQTKREKKQLKRERQRRRLNL